MVRMERNELSFQTGQFVLLSCNGQIDQREYSVYSGEQDNYLEVLVREVDNGLVSGKLKRLVPGDFIRVDGAFGFFRFDPANFDPQKFLFVATGTGISPFHSFVKTYAGLEYRLVHGVRFGKEAYEHRHFDKSRLTLCTSGNGDGDYKGRVTDYIRGQELDTDTHCFLCGNSEMIVEMFDILTAKGIPTSNIYSEVYF